MLLFCVCIGSPGRLFEVSCLSDDTVFAQILRGLGLGFGFGDELMVKVGLAV